MDLDEIKKIREKVEAEKVQEEIWKDRLFQLQKKEKFLKEKEDKLNALAESYDQADTTEISLQSALDRTWAAIDKNIIIKDLTSLTTQDEIYNAVIKGGTYIVSTIYGPTTITIISKSATVAIGLTIIPLDTFGYQSVRKITYTKGIAIAGALAVSPIQIGEPISSSHAATKHYVDAKFSESVTLVFDDGTSKIVKVGE